MWRYAWPTQRSWTRALAAAAQAEFGKIDILVYAAGTNSPDRSLRRVTSGCLENDARRKSEQGFSRPQAVLPPMRAAGSEPP
jgi:NAD(P)-dependent dehydrogenase (short-subunit alcohol dehydrogenase family)